jgi:DNA-binding LacI/PurR family transcriptional regulator
MPIQKKSISESRVRWESIAEEIRCAIQSGSMTPGTKLPSETVLARQHDVCRMTAHRAMRELQLQGYVERRRRAGTVVAAPRRRLTGRIGLLAFAADDFPTVEYLRGLREGLPEAAQLVLCDTGESGEREAQYLRQISEEADALVCFPAAEARNAPLMREIQEVGLPLVCLDRQVEGLDAHTIVTDNYGASLEAMRTLTARGHRRIAHFTDQRLMVSSTRERYEAYLQGLHEVGVGDAMPLTRFFTSFVVPRDEYFEHLSVAVMDALTALLSGPEPPTALFCLQDAYLAAALTACHRLGVSIPNQLEIVAFSDCPRQFFSPMAPVLRIVQQSRAMGRLAGETVTRMLNGESLPPQVLRVPAHLVDPVGRQATFAR